MKFNNRINIVIFCILVAFIMNGCTNKNIYKGHTLNPYAHESTEDISEDIPEQYIFNFNFDSSAILIEDYKKLDAVATYYIYGDGKDNDIIIYGHTDQVGTSSYNLALGEKRANSIKNYLVNKGMNPERMKVISFGFEKPAISGSTKEARTANRRVQIVTK
jgi:peptidoglycan-associated lipoprotein